MKVFLSCGDYSGDIHCSGIIEWMKKINNSTIDFEGIAGINCEKQGMKLLINQNELSCLGFTEAALRYFYFKKIFKEVVVKNFEKNNYDFCILSDFYGFNIHIAELSVKKNIPVYYFISPQIWASRFNRIKKLKRYINKMFVIFPFEEEIYRKNNIPVRYIGYPRMNLFNEKAKQRKENIITILPGSRPQQIKRHLPVILKAVEISGLMNTYKFYIIKSENNPENLYSIFENKKIETIYDKDFSTRAKAAASICSSGTASLENALLFIPTLVVFKTSLFTYLIARHIIKVKNIAMPNILLNFPLFPELIQDNFTPEKVSEVLINIIRNKNKNTDKFNKLSSILNKGNAYENFARNIFKNN